VRQVDRLRAGGLAVALRTRQPTEGHEISLRRLLHFGNRPLWINVQKQVFFLTAQGHAAMNY
jgi:hypothetical protein